MALHKNVKLSVTVVLALLSVLVIGGILTLIISAVGGKTESKPMIMAEGTAKAGTTGEANMANSNCEFNHLIGKKVYEAEAEVKASGRPYRILPPGAMATMDYAPERINLDVTGEGADATVVNVRCG
jgi:hypothetical protein